MYYVQGFTFSFLFESICKSLGDALNKMLKDEAARAQVEALRHVTSLQLMFNEASRQYLLIPQDISVRWPSSTRSLTLSLQSSEFDRLKADLMSEFNHVMLHQLLEVIKKPPANKVVSFIKTSAVYLCIPNRLERVDVKRLKHLMKLPQVLQMGS